MAVRSIEVRGVYRKQNYSVLFSRHADGWSANVVIGRHSAGTADYTLPRSARPGQTIAERLVGNLLSGRRMAREEKPRLKVHEPKS